MIERVAQIQRSSSALCRVLGEALSCLAVWISIGLAGPVFAADDDPLPLPPPQIERTLFDLYTSDAFVGGALANYTEEWCEIEDPLGTIEQIPDFRKERVEDVVPLLAGRIERTRTIPGVGSVLCDIYTFRVVVTLDPMFLRAQSRSLAGRLPAPESGFSLQQNIGVAAAGEFSGDKNSAFSHRSVVGVGRMFGRFNGAAVQGEAYELTEASAFGYVGDFEVGSGFLETSGQSFANSLQYTGVQLRTSDKVLLNPEDGRGSRLEVFVPSRSRVEFYRGGRLLSVQVLDFGLQEVDTLRFPQGSYDVDVVITESNGNVTRDRKFFTKSGFLTIRGRPSYDLQVGALREEFATEGTPVYLAGVQWRAADSVDLGGSVYGSDELAIAQFAINGLYRENYFLASSSVSTEGDLGVNGSFSTSLYDFTLNVGGAKTLKESDSSKAIAVTPTPSPNDPPDFIPRRSRTRELFFQDRTLYTANVRRTVGRLEFAYSIQGEEFDGDDTRRSRGPSLLWNIHDDTRNFLRFNIAYYDTDQGDVQSNILNYRYRISSAWNFGAQVGYYDREEEGEEVVGLLTLNYDEQRRSQYSTRLAFTSEARDRRGQEGGSEDGSSFTNQLAVDYGGDYLFGRAFVRNQSGDAAGNSSFGVNAESAVLIGNDGSTAISYPMAQDAVFIANIKGVSPGTKFEILLNDQVFDTVSAGKRSAVSVPPFRTYRVSIRPSDPNQLVDYDTTTHTITFFPGNVVERTWEVAQVIIVLGRLVDRGGNPIPLQRIRGTREYVATDEGGHFQAEIAGDEALSVESPTVKCTVTLPVFERSDYFNDLGDVSCL